MVRGREERLSYCRERIIRISDNPRFPGPPPFVGLAPALGGCHARAVEKLSRGIRDREVLLLLNGSAGTGKSTVLASTIASLADDPIRIIRVSDPTAAGPTQREFAARIVGVPIDELGDDILAYAIATLNATT